MEKTVLVCVDFSESRRCCLRERGGFNRADFVAEELEGVGNQLLSREEGVRAITRNVQWRG